MGSKRPPAIADNDVEMVTTVIIAAVCAWVLLALFSGEMRRQANAIDLAAQIAARKAERDAAAAAAAADLLAKGNANANAKGGLGRASNRPAR